MVKPYLTKGLIWFGSVLGLLGIQLVEAESYSQLFIQISDARTAVQENDNQSALALMKQFQSDFAQVDQHDSEAGQEVTDDLTKLLSDDKVTESELRTLSTALLAFESEQNPIDEEAEKANFEKKVYPALDRLKEVIDSGDASAMQKAYLTFNRIWTRNEGVVRRSPDGHYGNIETAMSLLYAAMQTEPLDQSVVVSQFEGVKAALDQFMTGQAQAVGESSITSLSEGIEVLKEALADFEAGDTASGQEKMTLFIRNWTSFEGEVSTRSAALYTKVETTAPVIMAKGQEKAYQEELSKLITELEGINTSSSYSAIDAMFILLREGVEALLIVMALVEVLRYAKQKKGIKWVYLGALLGILASGLTALLLQLLFPAVTAGTSRELIEGAVGIFAVIMLIGIGIWLHTKSSAKSWNKFLDQQMTLAMSSGSFLSMFLIAFLSVYREGAETVLFYIGILPKISLQDLGLGILYALVILVLIAIAIVLFSKRLPIHLLFKVLTWTIYILAFKMTGVSINALQLSQVIPNHVLAWLPSLDWLGIYSSLEPTLAQLFYVLCVIGLNWWVSKREGHHD